MKTRIVLTASATCPASNPDALPVGFVKDGYLNKNYMGLICAACHTAQINYQGLGMRI
jgi:hypothetical protein